MRKTYYLLAVSFLFFLKNGFAQDCQHHPGTLKNDTYILCHGDIAVLEFDTTPQLAEEDVVAYAFFDNEQATVPVQWTQTPEIQLVENLSENMSYFVASVIGKDDGNGLPDLADDCTEQSNLVEVIFLERLSVELDTWCQSPNFQLVLLPKGGLPAYIGAGFPYEVTIENEVFSVQAGESVALDKHCSETGGELMLEINDGAACSYSDVIYVSAKTEKSCCDYVTWLAFTGKVLPEGNLLEWVIAQQYNLSHYLIERSIDGVNLEIIDSVKATGDSDVLLEYEFLDRGQFAPLSYYRIIAVETGGYTSPTGIISLTRNDALSLTEIHPIVEQFLTFTFKAPPEHSTNAYMHNITGSQVAFFTLSNEQTENPTTIDISHLPSGIYFLTLTNKSKKITTKFIKP